MKKSKRKQCQACYILLAQEFHWHGTPVSWAGNSSSIGKERPLHRQETTPALLSPQPFEASEAEKRNQPFGYYKIIAYICI